MPAYTMTAGDSINVATDDLDQSYVFVTALGLGQTFTWQGIQPLFVAGARDAETALVSPGQQVTIHYDITNTITSIAILGTRL